MKYGRKALSMPMEIIIAVVVLVVIALAVIMFTTGGITKSGSSTQRTQDTGNMGIACQAAVTKYCAANPTALDTASCTECTAANVCGSSTFSCGRTSGSSPVAAAGCSKVTLPAASSPVCPASKPIACDGENSCMSDMPSATSPYGICCKA